MSGASRAERARLVLTQLEALGLTVDDLAAEAERTGLGCGGSTPAGPTVAEFLVSVADGYAATSLDTYNTHWRVLEEHCGHRKVADLTAADVNAVVDASVVRAKQRHPDRACTSAHENCVASLRAFFRAAQRHGIRDDNPAANLVKPPRNPTLRRALDDTELAEVWQAVGKVSRDAELDLLLVRFLLISGARREGAVNLKVRDLDDRRSSLWLDEKFGKLREQPVPPSLLAELRRIATERRGPSDPPSTDSPVFRVRRKGPDGLGLPLTRRHFENLFAKVQAELAWPRTPVTAHVLRHTAITAVERLPAPYGGGAVAAAFAGHAPGSGSVTAGYTKATIAEVAGAVQLLSGETHPLAPDALE